MKRTKKLVAFVCTVVMMISLLATTANAAKVGDVIGYAQPTDIVATINGYQLESYNVEGYTYICVEDLKHYGFKVNYDNSSRKLTVTRNKKVTSIDPQNTNSKFWSIGSNNSKKKILYTDIKTYVEGNYVKSSNINGQTIIQFDHLKAYGAVSYDNSKREISLKIKDMDYNLVAAYAELLHENSSYNEYWKIIYRAKGSVLMIIGTARSYMNSATRSDYINNRFPEDKADAKEIAASDGAKYAGVSSVYIETRNSDGTKIASYQTK